MKILYTIGWPLGQGGHINSTLHLIQKINELKQQNIHKIYLIAPEGPKQDYFIKLGVTYYPIKNYNNQYLFTFYFFLKLLKVATKNSFDVIHSMDFKSLKPTIYANLLLCKKIIFTKAGGRPLAFKLPKFSSFIVFSGELLDHYTTYKNHLSNNTLHLVKERIDILNADIKDYKLPLLPFKMFIAMRLKKEKKGLLDNLFDTFIAAKTIQGPLELNVAGDGELFDFYKKKSEQILKKHTNVKINFLGEINDKSIILKFNEKSHLIVGHGRGIMEAMVLGKPVVQLGFDVKGSVLVNKNNAPRLSHFNFSGRKLKIDKEDITLDDILTANDRASYLMNTNFEYIKNEYDARIGAEKTLKIYKYASRYNLKDALFNINWFFTNQINLLSRIFKKLLKKEA